MSSLFVLPLVAATYYVSSKAIRPTTLNLMVLSLVFLVQLRNFLSGFVADPLLTFVAAGLAALLSWRLMPQEGGQVAKSTEGGSSSTTDKYSYGYVSK